MSGQHGAAGAARWPVPIPALPVLLSLGDPTCALLRPLLPTSAAKLVIQARKGLSC